MARNKRKSRKSPFFIIISVLSFIILIGILVFDYYNINNKLALNKKLTKQFNAITKVYNTELDKSTELKNTIDELENIDTHIAETKDEVFKLASQLEQKILNNETSYKIAYITFDDGPYYSTNKVLNILKEYKVKATFFTIGLDKDTCYDNRNNSCKEMYKKIVDNGHTIANHTYSHLIFNGLYSSSDSFMKQVKLQEELIRDRTGVTTNILRFPGGSGTAKGLCRNGVNQIFQSLKDNHYGWVDWTAQDGDGGSLTSYDIGWKNLTGSINENIEVILFHDYNNVTISLLPNAIKYLQDRNYIILPLFYESVKVNK